MGELLQVGIETESAPGSPMALAVGYLGLQVDFGHLNSKGEIDTSKMQNFSIYGYILSLIGEMIINEKELKPDIIERFRIDLLRLFPDVFSCDDGVCHTANNSNGNNPPEVH